MPVDKLSFNGAPSSDQPESDASAQIDRKVEQAVEQSGKYGVNLGQGQGNTHIGDVYQTQTDLETVKRIIREELRLPQTEYSEPVRIGLHALADLMQVPEVRLAVITFQVDFQTVCGQINIIADYKKLHDLLHKLEFQCYSGIIQELRRFPDDEIALDTLTDHELTLEEILRDIQEVAERKTILTSEALWLKDLERAQEKLHKAFEELSVVHLQKAIWFLNRVLAIQPSRINTSLNASARMLRLPVLVNAMQSIWKNLSGTSLNQEKLSQFQQGVKVLAELDERLNALVIGHDYWQLLDLELRRIEANLEKNLIDLEMSWADLKERTDVLFDPDSDQWTVSFHQNSQNLDDALTAQNPTKIKRFFQRYRRQASTRFYQVDVTLNRLCEELRKVGEPLASVLRMLE